MKDDTLNDSRPVSSRRLNRIFGVGVALGLIIALAGLALDLILPGTSPGFNLPQLLIVAFGLIFAFISFQLRRESLRKRLARNMAGSILGGLLVSAVTLISLEFLLALFGMSTYFPLPLPEPLYMDLGVTKCSTAGCHFDYEKVMAVCDAGVASGRICAVNQRGFRSAREFIVDETFREKPRLLMLGDSYTFGNSAEVGKSYVETLESMLPDLVIWNAGIPGTGTEQALMSLMEFAPALEPQLIILGFVPNDFWNNAIPVESWIRVIIADNIDTSMYYAFDDDWGSSYSVDPALAVKYAGHALSPPRNSLEHALGTTRLGTLALRFRSRLGELLVSKEKRQESLTRDFLTQLRDLSHAADAALLVLLVPYSDDIEAPTTLYETASSLLRELSIPYVEVRHFLDPIADHADPPDGHWNSAGHQKVGAYLADCVADFFENRNLADCEQVVDVSD